VRDFEFWTVQNFSDAQLCVGVRNSWVGVRSLCVKYAWLWAGHASAVSAYASELVRNRARQRPSTDAPLSYHAWTAHVSRSFHWQSLTKLERSRSVRVWTRSVSDSCVGCSWNTAPYLIVCVDVRDMSVIVYKWYVRASCVILQWFLPQDTLKNWSISRRTSTHKPNLCVICEWFVRDRLCDWSLRYVLKYVLRYNIGKKLETEIRTRLRICPDDIVRISKLGRPNYFVTFLFHCVA
jgi:hypothetical protein